MVSLFGAFAKLEQSTVVDRLQSGRCVAIEHWMFMPRRFAESKMTNTESLAKYQKAVKWLKASRTIRKFEEVCFLSTKTIQKIKNALKLQKHDSL